jgi:hypothetical protein
VSDFYKEIAETQIDKWIASLDSDNFALREESAKQLTAIADWI